MRTVLKNEDEKVLGHSIVGWCDVALFGWIGGVDLMSIVDSDDRGIEVVEGGPI